MASIITILVFFLDRLAKYLAVKNLLLNQPLPLIRNFLSLTLVYNRGAAFGILKGQFPLFIFTSACAILFIYFSLKNHKSKKWHYRLSLSLILGGAAGNLVDRLSLGYVIDFIDFHIWPVFNLADSAITIGAVLLGYSIICRNTR